MLYINNTQLDDADINREIRNFFSIALLCWQDVSLLAQFVWNDNCLIPFVFAWMMWRFGKISRCRCITGWNGVILMF